MYSYLYVIMDHFYSFIPFVPNNDSAEYHLHMATLHIKTIDNIHLCFRKAYIDTLSTTSSTGIVTRMDLTQPLITITIPELWSAREGT